MLKKLPRWARRVLFIVIYPAVFVWVYVILMIHKFNVDELRRYVGLNEPVDREGNQQI
jgi:hypothetical protein